MGCEEGEAGREREERGGERGRMNCSLLSGTQIISYPTLFLSCHFVLVPPVAESCTECLRGA